MSLLKLILSVYKEQFVFHTILFLYKVINYFHKLPNINKKICSQKRLIW